MKRRRSLCPSLLGEGAGGGGDGGGGKSSAVEWEVGDACGKLMIEFTAEQKNMCLEHRKEKNETNENTRNCMKGSRNLRSLSCVVPRRTKERMSKRGRPRTGYLLRMFSSTGRVVACTWVAVVFSFASIGTRLSPSQLPPRTERNSSPGIQRHRYSETPAIDIY